MKAVPIILASDELLRKLKVRDTLSCIRPSAVAQTRHPLSALPRHGGAALATIALERFYFITIYHWFILHQRLADL